jgi:protein SCO1/2
MMSVSKVLVLVLLVSFHASMLGADGPFQPPDVKGVGIHQELNGQVPLDTLFRDETGNSVPLSKYVKAKPVVLAPVYYTCPMLCSQVMSGLVSAMRPLSMKPGQDFEVVAISFDPHDTPESASKKRLQYSRSYSSRAGTNGWHFLVGNQTSIDAVMNAIGFHYRWDPVHKMFIHASGIVLLTPEGRIARYLYGVDYEPKDLKLGLVESSHNRIGSAADQILLLCYHYDPKTGKYGATVMNVLRGSAILTLIAMASAGFLLWRRDLRQYRPIPKEVSQP